jgi:hypothetical protein
MAKVLLVPATAAETVSRRVIEQAEALQHALRATRVASHLEILYEAGSSTGSAANAMRRLGPSVVHFVGRDGSDREAVIADGGGPIDAEVVGEACARAGSVRCVILDGCWSPELGKALRARVDTVVAVTAAVDADAARAFADAFYRALGFGMPVARAFDLGANSARRAPGDEAVRLLVRSGVDAAQVHLPAEPQVPAPPPSRRPLPAPPSGRTKRGPPPLPSRRSRPSAAPPSSAANSGAPPPSNAPSERPTARPPPPNVPESERPTARPPPGPSSVPVSVPPLIPPPQPSAPMAIEPPSRAGALPLLVPPSSPLPLWPAQAAGAAASAASAASEGATKNFVIVRPPPDPESCVADVVPQAIQHLRSAQSPSPWREVAVIPLSAGIRRPLEPGSILGAARRCQLVRKSGPWASHPFFPWLDLGPRPEAGTTGLLWRFTGSRGFEGVFAIGFDGSFVQRELVREISHPTAGRPPGFGLFGALEAIAGAIIFARLLARQCPDYGHAWLTVRAGPLQRAPLVLDFEDGRPHSIHERIDVTARQPVIAAGGTFQPKIAPDAGVRFALALGAELAAGFGWTWDAAEIEAELRARLAAAD